jgi:hypothetical protein
MSWVVTNIAKLSLNFPERDTYHSVPVTSIVTYHNSLISDSQSIMFLADYNYGKVYIETNFKPKLQLFVGSYGDNRYQLGAT